MIVPCRRFGSARAIALVVGLLGFARLVGAGK